MFSTNFGLKLITEDVESPEMNLGKFLALWLKFERGKPLYLKS